MPRDLEALGLPVRLGIPREERELMELYLQPRGRAGPESGFKGAGGSSPDLVGVGGTVFFAAHDGTTGFELWKSDGSEGGTVPVKDINPGIGDSFRGGLVNVGGTIFLGATRSGSGSELWKSDGSEDGTVLVKGINPTSNSSPGSLTNVGGRLLFTADDGTSGRELWKSDGSEAGTTLAADVNPGAGGSSTGGSTPAELKDVGGTLFFNADDGTSGIEPWRLRVGGQPTLAIGDVTVLEGNGGVSTAVFTVRLSSASTGAVSVHYQTANDTAGAPADYTAKPDTLLSFAPGQVAKTVAVTVKGDTLDESDETFSVVLSGASGAALADSTGTGTIRDDEPSSGLELAVGDVTVHEGDGGVSTAVFTVRLSSASGGPVSVHYQTANGTATAVSDYVAKPDTVLSFAPGQVAKTVAVTVKGDTLDESDEAFSLLLSAASGATIVDSTGTGTIRDDDGQPTLAIGDVIVQEGHGGVSTAVFTVRLSSASTGPVSVHYQTANGTATAVSDYVAKPDTVLSFAPGQVAKTVAVTVKGDTLDESDEAFSVLLSAASGATIADSTGTGTIRDDEPPSGLELAVGDVTVHEGHGGTSTAVFTVRLSSASASPVSVHYQTANGTATAPADYTAKPDTLLSFSPGQLAKTVAVTVNGDTLDESDEAFSVLLSAASGATIADSTGTGTIRDDEG